MESEKKYVDRFVHDRKFLIEKHPSTWGKIRKIEDGSLPIIELPSPQLLSGFAGYLKFQCTERVFFRGEKSFHETTLPSLFRLPNNKTITEDEIKKRKAAFNKLVETIPDLYPKQARFKSTREDFRPLLQHYGLKTDWIDLVDNIFIALWFSNYNSIEKYSYIKFFVVANEFGELNVKDLRTENSSLSLRAHCQHGFSITKDVVWSLENVDFNSHLIAIAKIPNTLEMKLGNYIFSKKYMFPDKELDNTYKLLKRKGLQDTIDKIISEFKLEVDTLGRIC